MGDPSSLSEREIKLAKLLRPLGHRPMTKQQAERAAQLLGLHWTSVYRLRRKFLAKPVATSLLPKAPGRSTGDRFLGFQVEFIINEVLQRWLPKQERLAHPALDISMEVRKQCVEEGLKPPARNTVMARWHSLKEAEEAALAEAEVTGASPGSTCRRQWPAATGLPGSLRFLWNRSPGRWRSCSRTARCGTAPTIVRRLRFGRWRCAAAATSSRARPSVPI